MEAVLALLRHGETSDARQRDPHDGDADRDPRENVACLGSERALTARCPEGAGQPAAAAPLQEDDENQKDARQGEQDRKNIAPEMRHKTPSALITLMSSPLATAAALWRPRRQSPGNNPPSGWLRRQALRRHRAATSIPGRCPP